jgi:hypothetical protein
MSKESSAQWLVEWFVERFIHILNFTEWKIVWKHNLRIQVATRGKKEKRIYVTAYGLTEAHIETVWLNPSKRLHPTEDVLLKTLVHELAHVLLGDQTVEDEGIVPHPAVFELERIVDHLTPQHRAYLLSFVPERPVRKCRSRKGG